MLEFLRKCHGEYHEWKTGVLPYIMQRIKNPKAVYLVFTPEHGNLGDQAICLATERMLRQLNINYIEISIGQIESLYASGNLNVMNGFPILISGGGNMGSLYPWFETLYKKIVEDNPLSNIVIMPNTVYYDQTDLSKQEFEKSKLTFNRRDNVLVCVRENVSYEFLKGQFNNLMLCPDMVLSLNASAEKTDRKGCILCLRSDRECLLDEEEKKHIYDQVTKEFKSCVIKTDMYSERIILREQRETEVEKKLALFRRAELVITDRLHAMLFCVITGTPCIVVNSKSPKMKGCFEWIKDLGYIRFANDLSQIISIYHEIDKKDNSYNEIIFEQYFNLLKKKIKQYSLRK